MSAPAGLYAAGPGPRDRPGEVCYVRAMKLDAEKFLAMTLLLASATGTPGCGAKTDTTKKVEAKSAAPTPATVPAMGPGPTAQPPATPPAPAVAPTDPAAPGSVAGQNPVGPAKPTADPGPEEEKPSW